MASLIAVPLKRSVDVELAGPLRNLLGGEGGCEGLEAALEALQKARADAIWKGELQHLYRYHDLLASLMTKVPAHEVQIPFKWKDAFDKGSLFAGRASLTVPSLEFELVCVQWNIAAAGSIEAARLMGPMETDSEESLRGAARLTQQAAGLWAALKTKAPRTLQQEPTPDLRADTLHALHQLMLAQAQDCIACKCIKDAMKDSMVARVCAAGEELYGEAARAMARDGVKALWDRNWLPLVSGKQLAMKGLAQLHQANVCKDQGKVGEEIARLTLAAEALKAALASLGSAPRVSEAASKADRRLSEARRDNDFIYHERVPAADELETITRAAVAAATQPPLRFTTEPDPLGAMTPLGLRAALQAGQARRTEMAGAEVSRLREGTELLHGALASLGLPAALEAGSGVPETLRARAQAIQQAGGLAALERKLAELPELLTRNKEILEEARRMLREEEEADSALRKQFGARWTRTESAKLTEAFVANAAKYAQIIDNAVRADSIVQDKLRQHRPALELLQNGAQGLEGAVPAGSGVGGDRETLRQLVAESKLLLDERNQLEKELQQLEVPELKTRLEGVAAGAEQAALVETALQEALAPLRERVSASLRRQDKLQEALAAAGSTSGSGDARAEALARLTAAADAYRDLSANLEEGTKFYNDLTQLLVTFQNKVSDYCFARRTEKEELLKDLTQAASRPQPAPVEPGAVRAEAPAPQPAPHGTPGAPPQALPYPMQPQGMPLPYSAVSQPYYYAPPPMPALYNPYATLPHPRAPQYPPPPPQQQQYPPYPQQYPQYPQYPPHQ